MEVPQVSVIKNEIILSLANTIVMQLCEFSMIKKYVYQLNRVIFALNVELLKYVLIYLQLLKIPYDMDGRYSHHLVFLHKLKFGR